MGFRAFVILAALALAAPASEEERFIVHEWGTFTSVQGPGGIGLEGLQVEEEALPHFVYSRSKVRECPLREHGYKGLEVPAVGVTQKMETPVIYFHTKTPRRVTVRVDFVQGLLTQWYPVSDLLGPPERAADAGPLDLATVDLSFLQWDVDLIPRASGAPGGIPRVARADDPWLFARDVDAAYVRTAPRTGEGRLGPVEAEHYLFYRGLGRFELPIRVEATEEGGAVVRNGGAHSVPGAVVVEMEATRFRVWPIPGIRAGESAEALPDRAAWRDRATAADDIGEILLKFLAGEGLYDDEARAMVRTWSRSWFLTEGTRLLYVVPRPYVDEMLPLSIDPKPDATVRVLLGRIEFLSAERRVFLEKLLRIHQGDPKARRTLDRFGRFLEAHVRGVLATSRDERVLAGARALLSEGRG